MASSGDFTVGHPGSGADYTSWYAALASITSPLTGNLTFTQIAMTREGATTPLVPTLDLAGYTLKFTSNRDHNGSMLGGHLITHDASGNNWTLAVGNGSNLTSTVGTGVIIIEKLVIRRAIAGGCIRVNPNGTGSGNIDIIIRDILIDYTHAAANSTYDGIRVVTNSGAGRVYHCTVFNVHIAGMRNNGATDSGFYLAATGTLGWTFVENCVATEATGLANASCYYCVTSTLLTFNNCVGIATGSSLGWRSPGNAAGYSCMSTDTSVNSFAAGSGNIASIVPTDEFESVTFDDATWMVPKSTQAKDNGAASNDGALNNHGSIVTIARPHNTNKYSIGPREWPDAASASVQPSNQTEPEGDQATFSVTASNVASYQWQKKPYGGAWADIAGATFSSHTSKPVSAVDHLSQFRCKMSNDSGDVNTSEVYLYITGQPDPAVLPEVTFGFAS